MTRAGQATDTPTRIAERRLRFALSEGHVPGGPPVAGTARHIAGGVDPSGWRRLPAGDGTKGAREHDRVCGGLAGLVQLDDGAEYAALGALAAVQDPPFGFAARAFLEMADQSHRHSAALPLPRDTDQDRVKMKNGSRYLSPILAIGAGQSPERLPDSGAR